MVGWGMQTTEPVGHIARLLASSCHTHGLPGLVRVICRSGGEIRPYYTRHCVVPPHLPRADVESFGRPWSERMERMTASRLREQVRCAATPAGDQVGWAPTNYRGTAGWVGHWSDISCSRPREYVSLVRFQSCFLHLACPMAVIARSKAGAWAGTHKHELDVHHG